MNTKSKNDYYFTEEVIATLATELKKPQNDTFSVRLSTAAATAAHYFATNAFSQADAAVDELTERTGLDFPSGDRVLTAGLIAAAAIMIKFMRQEHNEASVQQIYTLAGNIQEGVYKLIDGRINGDESADSVAVIREDEDGDLNFTTPKTRAH